MDCLHSHGEIEIFDHPACGKDATKRLLPSVNFSQDSQFAFEFCRLAVDENMKDESFSWSGPDGLDIAFKL